MKLKNTPVFKSKLQFPVEVQLMIVLHRLGSNGEGASVAKIAALFGIGDGGRIDIITNRIFKAILDKGQFLTWPDRNERTALVAANFHELPHCIGYIDGTDVPPAEKPCKMPDDYY
uniref:Uncharacterized protein n=1 Tax=Lygus hesperus TaxID=30085 RepID=A0A0A9XT22_LYGHE